MNDNIEQKTANNWDNDTKKLSGAWNDFSTISEIRLNENVKDTKKEFFMKTQKALDELESQKGKSFKTVDELFDDLDK